MMIFFGLKDEMTSKTSYSVMLHMENDLKGYKVLFLQKCCLITYISHSDYLRM